MKDLKYAPVTVEVSPDYALAFVLPRISEDKMGSGMTQAMEQELMQSSEWQALCQWAGQTSPTVKMLRATLQEAGPVHIVVRQGWDEGGREIWRQFVNRAWGVFDFHKKGRR